MIKVVSVFGSAKLETTDPVQADSVAVGKALAENGYTVMSGGYGGVMAAASQGASEVGGHVIGVTVPYVNLIRENIVNPFVKEEIQCITYRERLNYLVEKADAYVVMAGGVGTLQELIEAWQMLRIGQLSSRPLICYGDFWRGTIEHLIESAYVPSVHGKMVQFAYTPTEVIETISNWRV
jgi:uncharacterized protein (TIGR00730 family)